MQTLKPSAQDTSDNAPEKNVIMRGDSVEMHQLDDSQSYHTAESEKNMASISNIPESENNKAPNSIIQVSSNSEKPKGKELSQSKEKRDNHYFFNKDFSSYPFHEQKASEVRETVAVLEKLIGKEPNLDWFPFCAYTDEELIKFIEYIQRRTGISVNNSLDPDFHLGNWMKD